LKHSLQVALGVENRVIDDFQLLVAACYGRNIMSRRYPANRDFAAMSRKQRGLATMIINVSPDVRTWIEKRAERSSDSAEIIKCIRAEMAREKNQRAMGRT
jgi:hypothetical protein